MFRDRFLAAVLRPFSGSGQFEAEARRMLGERIDEASPEDALLEEATNRIDAADAQPWWVGPGFRVALLVGVAAVVLWPTVRKGFGLVEEIQSLRSVTRMSMLSDGDDSAALDRILVAGASPEQARLLRASSTTDGALKLAESLWRDHYPDDPTVYYYYARRHLEATEDLPPGFLATAESLDPGNGYAAMVAAGEILDDVVTKERLPSRAPSGGRKERKIDDPLPNFTIEDEEALRDGLELFARAAGQPRFESRHAEFARRCLAGVAPPDNLPGRLARVAWAFGQPIPDVLSFRHVNDVICARTRQLEAAGDRKALAALARQWFDIMPRIVADAYSLVDVLVCQAAIMSTGRQLMFSCRALGLDNEASRLEPVVRNAYELRRDGDEYSES